MVQRPLIEPALREDLLTRYAKVTSVTNTTNFVADALAGYGDDYFRNWYVYVVWDSGGAGAAPQGERQPVSDYATATGTFTHTAFTASLAAGDEVLILHPDIVAAATGAGGYSGDIEIWDSFEYASNAALQSKWKQSGGANAPTRNTATPYFGSTCMQVVVGGVGVGEVHRTFGVERNIGTVHNISIAGRCNNAGDTFRFTFYDSVGNYSYWTQTLALANTWYPLNINPHSTPDGGSATPVDLNTVVELRLANLTNGTTYLFDLIKFESLVASKVGIGYDGLSDGVGITSSARGHLLQVQADIAGIVPADAWDALVAAHTGAGTFGLESQYIRSNAVTGIGIADSIANKLDLGAGYKPASNQYYTATRGPYLDILNTDSKYILTNAIPAPSVNSIARFIVSGGTALGTVLADSKSIIDALGHTGAALIASGIGAELRRGTGTQIPNDKGIYDYLQYLTGDSYIRLGAPAGASISADIAAIFAEVNAAALAQGGGSVASNAQLDSLIRAITDIVRAGGTGDLASILGYVDCLPAALGDLVTKNLADILSDSTAFAGLDIAAIKTQTDKTPSMRFPFQMAGKLIEEVQLTSVAGNKALGTITLAVADIPAGATVRRAYVDFKFREVENTNNANPNKLNGQQFIQVQKGAGAFTNANTLDDDMFGVGISTRETGMEWIEGDIDVSGTIDGAGAYTIQWTSAVADQNNLQFNDWQVRIRGFYSI